MAATTRIRLALITMDATNNSHAQRPSMSYATIERFEQFPVNELRTALTIFMHAMCDNVEKLKVDCEPTSTGIKFTVSTVRSDCGKVIGVQGRTARSLRIILSAAAKKYGKTIELDIREP